MACAMLASPRRWAAIAARQNASPIAVWSRSRIASASVVTTAIFPPKAPTSLFHEECSKENPPCTANNTSGIRTT